MQSCLRLKHGFRHNSGTAAIKMRASQAHPNHCTFKRVRGKVLQRSGRNPASGLLLEQDTAGIAQERSQFCWGALPCQSPPLGQLKASPPSNKSLIRQAPHSPV